MAAQTSETVDLRVLDDFEIPCDSERHSRKHLPGPAKWIISATCPACDSKVSVLRCDTGLADLVSAHFIADTTECGVTRPRVEWDMAFEPLEKK